MSQIKNWLPGRREDQLAMAKTWISVVDKKKTAWGIAPTAIAPLEDRVLEAEEKLSVVKGPGRTRFAVAQCDEEFRALKACMRDFKIRYFIKKPLEDADFISLGLKPKDTIKSAVNPPAGQVKADVSYPGPHLLKLRIKPLAGTIRDDRADHGCRIYYGILPHGGASAEAATGHGRYLMKAPWSGEDLPHSRFTRRKSETFDFPPEDSGKTAYFCIRLENGKGKSGPWGPMFNAVIP